MSFQADAFQNDAFQVEAAGKNVQGDASWWTMGSWCLVILLVFCG